ncbi:MAG: RluA family pseudouridine synthase [Clostridia bacterium]|nr:RluA family pseudouridine synthase [Clostridia bacterium]
MDILINGQYVGLTIRTLLQRELGFSANLIKKLKFTENGITVNGVFKTVRYELAEGDVLSLAVEDTASDVSPYTIPAELPIGILYEDEWLTVVDKPANMPAHPSLGHQLDTVSNALAWRYREKPYVFRPVNRLDRDTSGCMLTANTRDASYKMYTAMTTGKVYKTYLAVLDGVPGQTEGTLESYMHRKAESIIEREETSPDTPDAKKAVTEYIVIARRENTSVVLAHPITGRTHQLRVQFAGIGCPIVGDDLYWKPSAYITRHALHCTATCFPHPDTGAKVSVHAPVPEDIGVLLTALGYDAAEIEKIGSTYCEMYHNQMYNGKENDPNV